MQQQQQQQQQIQQQQQMQQQQMQIQQQKRQQQQQQMQQQTQQQLQQMQLMQQKQQQMRTPPQQQQQQIQQPVLSPGGEGATAAAGPARDYSKGGHHRTHSLGGSSSAAALSPDALFGAFAADCRTLADAVAPAPPSPERPADPAHFADLVAASTSTAAPTAAPPPQPSTGEEIWAGLMSLSDPSAWANILPNGMGSVAPGSRATGGPGSLSDPNAWANFGREATSGVWEPFGESSKEGGSNGNDDSWEEIRNRTERRERARQASSSERDEYSDILERCEIKLEDLKLGPKIGQGSFGDVLKGTWQNMEVAVKRLSVSINPQAQGDFKREVAMLQNLKHPNVINFIGACTVLPDLCIVMEIAQLGSLYSVLRNKKNHIDMSTVVRWASETARGMGYLHQRDPVIVHRDLKSVNLLVDSEWHIKVSDFGLARTKANSIHTQVGTWGWMAPEVLENAPYDEKADVYSFGVVLWELLTREEPFKGLHPMQIMRAIDRGERPPMPIVLDCPPSYVELLNDCWHTDPTQRPTFEQVLERLTQINADLEVYDKSSVRTRIFSTH
ncbi:Serine/threonine-protein kinase edr1 [Cymbomonas tetramitiformis]|uniref:Serine/threonine-protein kinase edr1 n=1 Tax=Cymbomonas tetramitiformis TaxID=36881 RepID=A0AAE0FJS3_9CHLO|nr:Serine/threonine-protein kinase edr1 [Cymbomonas tetramitiformis]